MVRRCKLLRGWHARTRARTHARTHTRTLAGRGMLGRERPMQGTCWQSPSPAGASAANAARLRACPAHCAWLGL